MGKSFQARSLRSRSHNLFIDFLNVNVLSDIVVYSAIPYEKIKAYIFLRRSLVHISYMYMIFFFYVGTFWGLAPPPPIQKTGYATGYATTLLAFAHQKSGQMKMADSVVPPPPPPLATRIRRHWPSQWSNMFTSTKQPIYMHIIFQLDVDSLQVKVICVPVINCCRGRHVE